MHLPPGGVVVQAIARVPLGAAPLAAGCHIAACGGDIHRTHTAMMASLAAFMAPDGGAVAGPVPRLSTPVGDDQPG
jgi:hypothetical protein